MELRAKRNLGVGRSEVALLSQNKVMATATAQSSAIVRVPEETKPVKLFEPERGSTQFGSLRIEPISGKRAIELTPNIVQIFLQTPLNSHLLDYIKEGKWLCFHLDRFEKLTDAVSLVNKHIDFAKRHQVKKIKLVIMSDLGLLKDREKRTARTLFGINGAFFRGYRNVTFEQAVSTFEEEIARANKSFGEIEAQVSRVITEKAY